MSWILFNLSQSPDIVMFLGMLHIFFFVILIFSHRGICFTIFNAVHNIVQSFEFETFFETVILRIKIPGPHSQGPRYGPVWILMQI